MFIHLWEIETRRSARNVRNRAKVKITRNTLRLNLPEAKLIVYTFCQFFSRRYVNDELVQISRNKRLASIKKENKEKKFQQSNKYNSFFPSAATY